MFWKKRPVTVGALPKLQAAVKTIAKIGALFIFSGALATVSPAATITVSNTNDGGAGSLRQAIADSVNSDTINFSVTGAITLTSGELIVNKSISIAGPGANILAVDGNAATRVFHIGPGTTVTISGLTIRNARATASTDLSGGGGGGIYNDHAKLTVTNTTLSGNISVFGGGICNNGQSGSATLTVSNSTLSGNRGGGEGGAIYNDGQSGGSATVTVTNNTLSGNSAGLGPGIANEGASGSATVTVTNSTLNGDFKDNGDGEEIFNHTATVTIGNTILNKGGFFGFNIRNAAGTVTSNGYNLSSDDASAFLNQSTDQNSTDPMLGPLAYYGGSTATLILKTGSPAIDKGKNFSASITDQRGPGFARTVDGPTGNATGGDGTDIGAFERQPSDIDPTLVVTTTADTNTNNTCSTANPCSLRDAITAANASGPDDAIYFGVTGTITLNSLGALPNLGSNLKILGPGANALTVKRDPAAANFRIFTINSGETITISGLTISGGAAATSGAFSAIRGGGIYNFHANLALNNCTVSGNSAPVGGGIENDGIGFPPDATLIVNNSTISGNSAIAFGSGGGINNEAGGNSATLTINNSTISGNSAGGGGGILNYYGGGGGGATLTINNSTISGNSAPGGGGGIANLNTAATVDLTSTILNTGASGENIGNAQGVVTSHGYNLSSDAGVNNTSGGTGALTATGDQTNTNPMLGPLQDNGGPTFTHALLPGSPAIDKGKSVSGLTTDQRGPGFARTFDKLIANATGGDGTDIGAFEVQNVAPTIIGATISRSQGAASNSQIATVSDDHDQSTALTVTVNGATTVNGVTVSNLAVDGSGNVTASVSASCSASNATFTLRATDTGGLFAEATLTVNVTANAAPSITAVAVNRTAGNPLANSQIAQVGDDQDARNALSVTVNGGTSATVNGVTVTLNPVAPDTSGHVFADVVASCAATTASFTLRVTDSCGLITETPLTVNVTANTAPTLTYNNASVAYGGSVTINPASGPSDNVSVTSVVLQSQGTYTGTISVDNTTGVVSISHAAPAGSHTITIRATDNCNVATDASFTLDVAAAIPARALNISTRLRVDTGDKVMIGGFIITGTTPKQVVLRGLGPSLVTKGIPAASVLNDPVIELHGASDALVITNDNWKDSPQRAQIEGTVFQPTDDRESVILTTLPPAAYTVILKGVGGTSGVGLIEVYDRNSASDSELANISTRGFVQTGTEVMIGGFMLGANPDGTRIAIRGLGPSLSSAGLTNLLADPTLELHDGNGGLLISNDNWQDDPVSAAQLTANGLAPHDPKEAAIFTTLPPGAFTAILAGKNGGVGIGLVEIYNLK